MNRSVKTFQTDKGWRLVVDTNGHQYEITSPVAGYFKTRKAAMEWATKNDFTGRPARVGAKAGDGPAARKVLRIIGRLQGHEPEANLLAALWDVLGDVRQLEAR